MKASGAVVLAGCAAVLAACAASPPPQGPPPAYQPDRRDYAAFRERYPDTLDPNYLPFMAHVLPAPDGGGWALVLCRWDDAQMPVPVYIGAPEIDDDLQDEFSPRSPALYVEAVEGALARWQTELEGLVRFRRVESRREAELELLLVGDRAPAPEPDVQVLGRTPLAHACRVRAGDGERLDVSFSVRDVRIYVADQHGLLEPDQVEWIALHEIGHALGMRGHSPIPADLMYEVVRDRVRVPELSTEDAHSFLALYQLPNGTVYGRVPAGGADPRPEPPLPEGPPELALAPYVDARLGFQLVPPRGWMRVPTSRGVALVDGVTWDYTASFQVAVQRYPTIEAYLDRYGPWYLAHRVVRGFDYGELHGYRTLRAELLPFDRSVVERLTVVEVGDGRVFVVTADCPPEAYDTFVPWFEAALTSLEIWEFPPRSRGRVGETN